jgi:hypothetical protein
MRMNTCLRYECTVGHEEGQADENQDAGGHAAHRGSNPARIVDGRPTRTNLGLELERGYF